jgi:hypothetical protein
LDIRFRAAAQRKDGLVLAAVGAATAANQLRLKIRFMEPELTGVTDLLVSDPKVPQLYRDYLVAY